MGWSQVETHKHKCNVILAYTSRHTHKHAIHKLTSSVLHLSGARTAPALSCLLSNNPLPREKQSVLDLKEKGTGLYHVQLSSRQNASAQVRKEKCCHWGVVPFIYRLSRMEIMGWECRRDENGWRWGDGGVLKEWICFLTPPSHSSAPLIEASMRLFQLFCSLSFPIPRSGQTHLASTGTPYPPPPLVCVWVYVHAQVLISVDLAMCFWLPGVLFCPSLDQPGLAMWK